MIEYIKEFPNATSSDFCEGLIQKRIRAAEGYEDIVFWRGKGAHKNWSLELASLEELALPLVSDYFSQFGELVGRDNVHLAGFGLVRQPPGAHDSLHFDTQVIVNKDGLRQRPFVCLLYLNDTDFEGGQLLFPAQKKIVQPEAGKLLIFPASYMFPHQVMTLAGGDRYFVRLNFMFHDSLFDEDLDEWDIEKQGAQKF